MQITIKESYKSLKSGVCFELPKFTVLTGKNGSGKSHLMEALSHHNVCSIIDEEGKPLNNIRYIGFNGLNPKVDSDCQYFNIAEDRQKRWREFKDSLEDYQHFQSDYGSFINYIGDRYGKYSSYYRFLSNLNEKEIENFDEDLFYKYYEISSNDMFSSQFASIFKLYHIRLLDNQFKEFRNKEYGESEEVLSPDEFVVLYGPKPWDLINDILAKAHLPYKVNHPEGSNKEQDFHLCLKDENTGVEIQVNDLSTGEKVLMSLALSIYNTKEENVRPDVLCIDEPDAPLHPEFSKILIDAINDSIVKEAGVRVIISTHSPSTVIIAPEETIYLMNKDKRIPIKINKQEAVNLLICDIDNLRVGYEDRRQVFVESSYDVAFYTRIRNILSPSFVTTPCFLAPRSGNGSNCDDVKMMVNALRSKGNDLVYGIIDYDNHNCGNKYVFVLGDGERYAIDNYIFDPIYVAFLLVYEKIVLTEEMGIGQNIKFVQFLSLSDEQFQMMIDYVSRELNFNTGELVDYTVLSNKKFKVDKGYFTIQGHTLEDKIKEKWPRLKAIAKGGDDKLKLYMLDRIINEYPDFISVDFVKLFDKIQ